MKGQKEIFVENLPGLPDNIRLSTTRTLYVGLAGLRHADAFSLVDKLGSLPWLRKLIVQVSICRPIEVLFADLEKIKFIACARKVVDSWIY